MVTKKSVASEIISLSSIKGMVEAYEEIAAMRINRTQDAVLKSRVFTQEINDIFQHVKSSAKKEIARIMKIKKIKDRKNLSFLEKNGKTLFVYLSSNTGLYGDIIKRTFDLFAKYVDGLSDNVVIIGKLGLKIASERGISQPITYFDFPDNSVDEAQLQKIAAYLIGFERVIVFYGLFESILHQKEAMLDISGNSPPTQVQEEIKIKYFFEPGIDKILAFFEKEIFSSILEQVIRESQLAKFSSRVVELDSAIENINKELKRAIFKKRRLRHEEANKKQLQTLSSISLWRT